MGTNGVTHAQIDRKIIHTSTWVGQSIYLGNGHVIYKAGILDYSVQRRFTLNMGNKIILLMLGIKS